MSAVETAERARVSKGSKLPATWSNRKKFDVDANMEQSHVELYAWNIHVTELEACVTEFEKQVEQSASQVRVAESNYSLLYDEIHTLKPRLSMDVACD